MDFLAINAFISTFAFHCTLSHLPCGISTTPPYQQFTLQMQRQLSSSNKDTPTEAAPLGQQHQHSSPTPRKLCAKDSTIPYISIRQQHFESIPTIHFNGRTMRDLTPPLFKKGGGRIQVIATVHPRMTKTSNNINTRTQSGQINDTLETPAQIEETEKWILMPARRYANCHSH